MAFFTRFGPRGERHPRLLEDLDVVVRGDARERVDELFLVVVVVLKYSTTLFRVPDIARCPTTRKTIRHDIWSSGNAALGMVACEDQDVYRSKAPTII